VAAFAFPAGPAGAAAGVEAVSSLPTSPAKGQSLAAWTETSKTKAAIATAINTVPETAPAR
jgi:hypothetical protein